MVERKAVEIKAFLSKSKHQYRVSQCEEHDCRAYDKKMEIITSIQACLISWMNTNYKENGGKKSFSCQTKESISCIPIKRTCLWWQITKEAETIIGIHVCLI